MHDEAGYAGGSHRTDEAPCERVVRDSVDAKPMLDADRRSTRSAHRRHALGYELRLAHQAGAEAAACDPFRRAAAIQVDFVITPFGRESHTLRKLAWIAA